MKWGEIVSFAYGLVEINPNLDPNLEDLLNQADLLMYKDKLKQKEKIREK
ncbi:hypothetical protein [Thermodesulfovibrio hydrogeniphilus]